MRLNLLMLLIPKIKNMEYPVCKDCKHFIQKEDITLSRCSFFGEKDVITGEIKYNYADISRFNENLCGINGTYYKK